MLIVIGRGVVAEGKRDELIEAAKDMQEASRGEEGCIDYGFFTSIEDPDQFIAVELWKDHEALTEHFQTEWLARFGPILGASVVGAPTVEVHEVSGQAALPSFE